MYLLSKNSSLIIQVIFCCCLLNACNPQPQSSEVQEEFQTLSEITKNSENKNSFSNRLVEVQKETELIDDSTEKMLNRHKTMFILGIILFFWLTVQSLINYRQD